MFERRHAFFAFQGLLTVVLLLFFLFQRADVEGWAGKFSALALVLLAILLFLQLAPGRLLGRLVFQGLLFVADALIASLTLHWTQQPQSDLYLTYFVIIFGSALTRNLLQNFIVALCASLFYIFSAYDAILGFPREPEFWLRIPFLWTMASLAAILSQDSRMEQQEQARRYQDKLMQMEKIAALGQFSGEVAHRIKGPLTTIMVNADVLMDRHSAARKTVEELGQIREAANRCREILKDLLNLGRFEEVDAAVIDLRQPVSSALESVRPQIERTGIRLKTEGLDQAARVTGDASLLHEAISGLLQNAVEAMPRGGDLTVVLGKRKTGAFWSGDNNSHFEVEIRDTGAGINPNDLGRIFRPFFTTKHKEGNGLGLTGAMRILQNHHGTIEAHSEGKGKGACFRVVMPAVPVPGQPTAG